MHGRTLDQVDALLRRALERIEALEVGAGVTEHGNPSHSPDFIAVGEAPTVHKDSHKDAGSDAFVSTDVLRAQGIYLGAPGAHGEALFYRNPASGGNIFLYGDLTAVDFIKYDPTQDRWVFAFANSEVLEVKATSTMIGLAGGVNAHPVASSLWDAVSTTTKGSRPFPRLTTAERNAIASPATGLMIWNTSTAQV